MIESSKQGTDISSALVSTIIIRRRRLGLIYGQNVRKANNKQTNRQTGGQSKLRFHLATDR